MANSTDPQLQAIKISNMKSQSERNQTFFNRQILKSSSLSNQFYLAADGSLRPHIRPPAPQGPAHQQAPRQAPPVRGPLQLPPNPYHSNPIHPYHQPSQAPHPNSWQSQVPQPGSLSSYLPQMHQQPSPPGTGQEQRFLPQ